MNLVFSLSLILFSTPSLSGQSLLDQLVKYNGSDFNESVYDYLEDERFLNEITRDINSAGNDLMTSTSLILLISKINEFCLVEAELVPLLEKLLEIFDNNITKKRLSTENYKNLLDFSYKLLELANKKDLEDNTIKIDLIRKAEIFNGTYLLFGFETDKIFDMSRYLTNESLYLETLYDLYKFLEITKDKIKVLEQFSQKIESFKDIEFENEYFKIDIATRMKRFLTFEKNEFMKENIYAYFTNRLSERILPSFKEALGSDYKHYEEKAGIWERTNKFVIKAKKIRDLNNTRLKENRRPGI